MSTLVSRIIGDMARITRAERQAATRADILAAARARFLRDGYAPTSLEQIAEDAGYSKGAVYSNFRDKPTLCREVLEAIHDTKLGEVRSIIAADRDIDELLADIEDWLERTVGDVGWTMLEMEFAVVSRGNVELTRMIGSLHGGMHDAIVTALRGVGARLGLADESDRTYSEFADLIVATTFGLGVQRAVDPTISIRPAVQAIRGVVATLTAGGSSTPAAR
ncbi:TetR/AcrR family transcriptional regulator [Gordonia soli]|uniref:Putative TetR family transcriptional regulator n=1 Tax=Gordonia soli NBRC 108243 TaxID=1223545 RepID=M0QQM1_9ACTN|nr:TetR/AcrR family transcriptional regulator [Gordonia soli]GAC70551.1 putative TetR family transcriptional regulator [Gordonia soli NBRC 108243]